MTPETLRPADRSAGRLRASRRGGSLLALALVGPLAGCYSTRPVTTAPVPGTTVLLDLNDLARVQLGDRIGPSVARIEGVVQEPSDTAYVLHMSAVTYLDGQTNKWSGEPFTVPSRLVTRAQAREFSRSRTSLLGAGIVAGLAVLFGTTHFLGKGGGDVVPPPPGGGTS